MLKLPNFFELPGLLFSGIFGLVAFIVFYTNSAEALKSLVAASFVFFLAWLSYTVVRWIFEMIP